MPQPFLQKLYSSYASASFTYCVLSRAFPHSYIYVIITAVISNVSVRLYAYFHIFQWQAVSRSFNVDSYAARGFPLGQWNRNPACGGSALFFKDDLCNALGKCTPCPDPTDPSLSCISSDAALYQKTSLPAPMLSKITCFSALMTRPSKDASVASMRSSNTQSRAGSRSCPSMSITRPQRFPRSVR